VKTQGGGGASTLKCFSANKVPVLAQQVVVGEALFHESLALAFRHGFPLLLLYVSKANVFHDSSPGINSLHPVVVRLGAKST
jgi:hypothetical protein